MTGRHSPADIAVWAEARAARSVSGALSRAEQWQIVSASKRAGMTLERLAAEFGRTEVEVGRVLAEWTDTTDAAKHLLKARAMELADRMMTDADPGIALEILERLHIVESPQKGGGLPFVVQIGIKESDVKLNLGSFETSGQPPRPLDEGTFKPAL